MWIVNEKWKSESDGGFSNDHKSMEMRKEFKFPAIKQWRRMEIEHWPHFPSKSIIDSRQVNCKLWIANCIGARESRSTIHQASCSDFSEQQLQLERQLHHNATVFKHLSLSINNRAKRESLINDERVYRCEEVLNATLNHKFLFTKCCKKTSKEEKEVKRKENVFEARNEFDVGGFWHLPKMGEKRPKFSFSFSRDS